VDHLDHILALEREGEGIKV
jgi:hypothetical protein